MTLLWTLATSRIGLLVLAFAGIIIFYEGVPIGPLGMIPFVGPLLENVTDGRVDRERKRALEGYVLRSELDAEKAKAAKEAGRRLAAEHALAAYTRRVADELAEDALQQERLEQEIADNEKLLAARGRACVLDDADIDFLRKPRGKTKGRR